MKGLSENGRFENRQRINEYAAEAVADTCFPFGQNWRRFVSLLDEKQIIAAEKSLREMLEVDDLKGETFLDIGSGSGLFSLAARRIGAKVYSFDCDHDSVACTVELKRRFFPGDSNWRIERGDVLDVEYLNSLGHFDIVYSWGVLHHTGAMYKALENAALPVAAGGKLFIAIYNDQGWFSQYWKIVKKGYNTSLLLRWLIVVGHAPYLFGLRFLVRAFGRRLSLERGMSLWYDMLDWLGGYPFEVASPSAITKYFERRGFIFATGKTCGHRHGCNEFVFVKKPVMASS